MSVDTGFKHISLAKRLHMIINRAKSSWKLVEEGVLSSEIHDNDIIALVWEFVKS